MNKEIFKIIPSYKNYEVSNLGKVRNISSGRILSPNYKDGYDRVRICGKYKSIHRLVAELFVPNPDNKSQVRHKNNNKKDNNFQNLLWVTPSENAKIRYMLKKYLTVPIPEEKEVFTLKGSKCSVNGKKYEACIYNIVKKCTINGKKFNTQNITELGGCFCKNDIECSFICEKDIPIEIKKLNSPDWMQCSLIYNIETGKWMGSSRNKIPEKSKILFENLLGNTCLFNGKIPPFLLKNVTHEEWKKIKKETGDFSDMYINCPDDTIKKLYREKGCVYIQISEKGLYHLGKDVCEFGVCEFKCEQNLRIRTKIHSRKDTKGFCKLSVIVSCQPKNSKQIIESRYTLDNIKKLPEKLYFEE